MVASVLGVSQPTVSRWESGRLRMPRYLGWALPEVARRLAARERAAAAWKRRKRREAYAERCRLKREHERRMRERRDPDAWW